MHGRSPRAVIICCLLLAPAASGCGLFYNNSYEGASFHLYSDRNPEFVAGTGARVTRIYEGYRELFDLSPESLGTTTIVLEGKDTEVIDYRYSPSLLGYYIPLFNFISVDTACAWAQGEEMLEQILLHEVSHHFIVTEYPAASQECWLNEGLAGALEVCLFDETGFESPLLNPVLFQIAQRVAYSGKDALDLKKFLGLSWSEFHEKDTKERNYALAWSIVFFLLDRQMDRGTPLGERIEDLYHVDRDSIAAMEKSWVSFLRGYDLTGRLLRLAKEESPRLRLTSRWATAQIGLLRGLDDLRALEGLASLFEDPDDVKRARSFDSFLKVLERTQHSYIFDEKLVADGLRRLETILQDPSEPVAVRRALATTLGDGQKTSRQWVPGLVQLLDKGDGGLRAAAARALSRIAPKPTIVNPSFWVAAPPAARSREVAEWRHWLARQGEVGEKIP